MSFFSFSAPGLTGESYYRTKRSNLSATLIVVFGLASALYAGVAQWTRLAHGLGALEPGRYTVSVTVTPAYGSAAVSTKSLEIQ